MNRMRTMALPLANGPSGIAAFLVLLAGHIAKLPQGAEVSFAYVCPSNDGPICLLTVKSGDDTDVQSFKIVSCQ